MPPSFHGFRCPRPVIAVIASIFLALCSSPAVAQRLSIRTFSGADGLGSSFVNHIMQDSAGYFWFATRDGLSRWNGYEFTTLAQAGGFSTPAIDSTYQARSGEYWVVCNDGSLYSYLPTRPGEKTRQGKVLFRRRRVQFDGRDVRFTRLYEDSNGILWGSGDGVLVKGVGSTNTVIPLNRPAPPFDALVAGAMQEDRTGSLWIGTSSGLLCLTPDGRIGHHPLAPNSAPDGVQALALDRAGRIWVGHRWLGLFVLNPGRGSPGRASQPLSAIALTGEVLRMAPREGEAAVLTTANGLPDNGVVSLLAASNGDLWVGTAKGLARFDGVSFTRYTTRNGLSDNVIDALCEDADGHLWVATPTGAMRVALEGLSGYTVDEGLATDSVVAIGKTPGGSFYALGAHWSVNIFDGRRFRGSRLPLPAASSSIWASQVAYCDRQGRWWALTNQGLYRFAPVSAEGAPVFARPDRVYTTSDGLPGPQLFRLYQDRSGVFWVGTRSDYALDNGLARFDLALGRATRLGAADGLPPHSAPSAFAEDRHGNLWIGFYQGGLARRRDGRFRTYTAEDGIPQGMVTALLVDRAGRLWVSTNLAGVSRVDDPSADSPGVRTYSTRDGLTSNNVRALAEDRDGRIYAGSARGVDRLDPATGRIRHYGAEDGLVKDFITAAFCDSRGDLWFGTYGGVFRLRPVPEREEEPPPIVITGLRIAGESYPVEELGQASVDRIVLEPHQRELAIDFVSVSRHRGQGITYQYSMESRSQSWSRPTAARNVNFTRLPPGDYRFAVRAVTAAGKASPTPATVVFTIRAPLWQRWWGISLGVAALGAVLLGLYRYRVHRLLELERLRMGIASDLHDEVATNLSSIATFSALVRGELGRPSPFLDRITVLATESADAIREIIWSIDPRPETIGRLLVRLHDAMVTSCRAHGLHLTMSAPPAGMEYDLTPEQRKNLWLMLKEALTNAATHSGGTELSVTVAPVGKQVRITVRDNGTGLPPSGESSGKGLATMRARAGALGGTMSITSDRHGGTAVEFLVTLAA